MHPSVHEQTDHSSRLEHTLSIVREKVREFGPLLLELKRLGPSNKDMRSRMVAEFDVWYDEMLSLLDG